MQKLCNRNLNEWSAKRGKTAERKKRKRTSAANFNISGADLSIFEKKEINWVTFDALWSQITVENLKKTHQNAGR